MRALRRIGQRAALDLFGADTALIGGVGAGGSHLLAVLSGLGFCQFPPLMPHKSCRLFRRRTCKVCRFRLSGVGVIFPRGGAGLFLRFRHAAFRAAFGIVPAVLLGVRLRGFCLFSFGVLILSPRFGYTLCHNDHPAVLPESSQVDSVSSLSP